jgi:O-antigen ligase
LTYFGTAAIIFAISSYIFTERRSENISELIIFIRNCYILSSLSVFFSPILYEYYYYIPDSAGYRYSGFFANPNEAAIASLLALTFTIAVPFRTKILQLVLITIIATAVILTFSKGAIVTLAIVLTVWLMQGRTWLHKIGAIALAAAIVLSPSLFSELIRLLVDGRLDFLDDQQKMRLVAVGDLLGGRIDDDLSTGRTFIWQIAVERINNNFPFGSGLGSGHHLYGGILEGGVWQGTHNAFLMILLEAGIFAVIPLATCLILIFKEILDNKIMRPFLPILIVIIGEMLMSHEAFSSRYANVAFGLMLALPFSVYAQRNTAVRL